MDAVQLLDAVVAAVETMATAFTNGRLTTPAKNAIVHRSLP